MTTAQHTRILIVDDQPINIRVLYQILHDTHEVFMATSGKEALDFCRNNQLPDLILLDVVMPEMDGLEVCRQLKANIATTDIPIIFVTSQSAPLDETRALEVGGVDFISKPVNPAVIRARIKTQLTLKAQSDQLRAMALIDGLTGVANRRRFDEALDAEWRRCRRSASPLALIMIDIDHFKMFNDRYGHQAGDTCLQTVASRLQGHLSRSHDLVARYGGEEFVCLLPECDLAASQSKAEELRVAVTRLNIPHDVSPTAAIVTVSLGIASVVPNDDCTPGPLLAAADSALYAAKSAGRNCIVTGSIAGAA